MDNNRRVVHGTPIHDQPSLCHTCRHAHVVKGLTQNQEYILCGNINNRYSRVMMKVVECNEYGNRNTPSLRNMEEIAWSLATDRKGHKIGFMSPTDFRKARNNDQVNPLPEVQDPFGGEGY